MLKGSKELTKHTQRLNFKRFQMFFFNTFSHNPVLTTLKDGFLKTLWKNKKMLVT